MGDQMHVIIFVVSTHHLKIILSVLFLAYTRGSERRMNHNPFVNEIVKCFFIAIGVLLARSVMSCLFGSM
ncbi:unnamed protein product [Linum tenue]|uniref:Uncharacterized protein n=1 Tax=Linum tenue TaxID=586396 RepID=A0AAV0HLE2_9ROSI|nr:unnamed protein product [Linum tenue]